MSTIYKDKLLEALNEAIDAWDKSFYLEKKGKLALAKSLHRHELFSIPQLSKIVRLNARALYEELSPNADGGRFEPETLTILRRIRQARVVGEKVSPGLVRTGIKGGTSFNCMVRLTGLPYATYYPLSVETNEQLRVREDAKNMKYTPKVTPEVAAEIHKMRRNRFTQQHIADTVGVHVRTVAKILAKGEQ